MISWNLRIPSKSVILNYLPSLLTKKISAEKMRWSDEDGAEVLIMWEAEEEGEEGDDEEEEEENWIKLL